MSSDEYARRFFKTRLCRFYSNSKCFKGAECSHAHSREELLERPNLRKTALCRNWSSSSSCDKGRKCPYAHGGCELRTLDNVETPPQTQYHGSSNKSHSSSEAELNADDYCPRTNAPPANMCERYEHPQRTRRGRIPTNGPTLCPPAWVGYDPACYILPTYTAYQYQFVRFPYYSYDHSPHGALQD